MTPPAALVTEDEDVPMSGPWADAVMEPIFAEGDRYSRYFVLGHFGIGLALAPFYDTWLMAIVIGTLAAAMFLLCAWLAPRTLLTRCIAGVSLQAFVALHVYQLHGLPEMHFFFFSAFTMLITYQDWRAPWPGTLLIIGQHIWFASLENSGVEMNFFPGEVAFWQLFFHFGIALLHVGVCSHWATRLRRNTLREAWDQRRLDLALQKSEAGVASRSRFLATMSHEIRTPMNGVLGMLTLLERTTLDTEQHEYLGIARRSGEGLLGVIDDVLDFSKLEAGRMTAEDLPFSVRDLLKDVHALLLPQATNKHVAFTCDVAPDVPAGVSGDSRRLRQILLNLTGNALKFTAHGHVRVSASTTPFPGGAMLHLSVEDTGIGMTDETVARLFTEFTQADASTTRRFGGTGLGLAISQRLARLLGGQIAVTSVVGRGTTFSVAVPVRTDVALPVPETAPQSCDQAHADLLRVLLVEDNPVNQLVTTRLLEREQCIVSVAADGLEGLAQLERDAFDLILMDCHMPVMDGFEAARRIRESVHREVPIVALTASVLEEDRQRCVASGMDAVLPKPLPRGALAALVRDVRGAKHGARAAVSAA